MGVLAQDISYNLRRVIKKPGLTLAAAFSIALALGANTMVFSLINAFMLRPLPFEDPERLVAIHETQLKQGLYDSYLSFPNFIDLKDQNSVLADTAAYEEQAYNLGVGGEPERVYGVAVSTNLFSLLGVKPISGRDFLPEESRPGADRVVILSENLWKRRFGSDSILTGKTLILNGETYSVVGVMPPRFKFPETSVLWTPLVASERLMDRGQRSLSVIGRLKPGVAKEQAKESIAGLTNLLQEQYPESNRGWGMRLVPLREELVGQVGDLLNIFLGAVLFMLLIACANVSNLYLAQAVVREREIAIRTALGASRYQLIRQLLIETVMVALLGGVIGILLAYSGLNLLVSAIPIELPFWIYFDIDIRVLIFTFIVSLLAGVIFGLVPALRASKPDINSMLKEGSGRTTESRRRGRLQGILIVSEVSLALILLIGAMLMIQSFLRLQKADPGFETRNILTMVLTPYGSRYVEGNQRQNFFQQVVEQTKTLSGVKAVAVVNNLPIGQSSNTSVTPENRSATGSEEALRATSYIISPDYFQALGIPIINGRQFSDMDTASAPRVAIINEAAALRLWPNIDAVNQQLRLGKSSQNVSWISVVGVVKDFKQDIRDDVTKPQVYLPYTQKDSQEMTLVISAVSDPTVFTSAIREQISTVDRSQPVFGIATMERRLTMSVWQSRIYGLIFGVFAALALILAALGVYGVIAYSVRQRSHEIGIRMALGARKGHVLRSVLAQGMLLAIIGTVIGLLAAFAITNVLSGFLYGVTATDPLTFGGTALLLLAVALAANLVPALKATRVDPIIVLREN
ncbi:MAG: ABC transporter permease [Blastocatellia bacterium]